MRLLLRRTALAVASRRSSRATVAMTIDAAAAAADTAARSSLRAAAIAVKKSAADGDARTRRPPPPALAPDPDLDLAAAAFALSSSAALGLDSTGTAADASRGPRVDHLIVSSSSSSSSSSEEEEEEDGEKEGEDIDLVSFVAERSAISRVHALALLELGAVWWCPVPPPPPRSYGSFGSDGADAEAARAAAQARHGRGRERHGRGSHLFQPRRAAAADRPPRGSYVRVHVRPKRYFYLEADNAEESDGEEQEEDEEEEEEEKMPTSLSKVGYGASAWARRLVAVSEEFAVLNKPPCVPSVPTVDNGVEHALSGAAIGIAEVLRRRRARRRPGEGEAEEEASAPSSAAPPPLPPPPPPRLRRAPKGPQATGAAATGGLAAAHRLDHGASGVLAIGRTPRFVAGFQELSKRGRVAKVYRAALVAEATAAAAEGSAPSSAAPPRSLPRPGDTLVHWAQVNARPHGAPPRTLMFDEPGSSSAGGGGGARGAGGEGEGESEREGGRQRARCELRIVSMKRVSLLPSAAEALGVAAGGREVWEACILLITGRTHQVREERRREKRESE